MARRMIGTEVYNDDRFTDLSVTARLLYTYLILNADDDGFLSNVKTVLFTASASKTDLQELIDTGFIIKFNSGVYVIKHWRLMNSIKKDRYKATIHVDEFSQLKPLTDNKKVYEISCVHNGDKTETKRKQNGDRTETQVKLSQVKVSKDKLSKDNIEIDGENADSKKLRLFFNEAANKSVKDLFNEKIGAIRNMKEYCQLQELIEIYGADYVATCIEKTANNQGKTVQYLKRVCESENTK